MYYINQRLARRVAPKLFRPFKNRLKAVERPEANAADGRMKKWTKEQSASKLDRDGKGLKKNLSGNQEHGRGYRMFVFHHRFSQRRDWRVAERTGFEIPVVAVVRTPNVRLMGIDYIHPWETTMPCVRCGYQLFADAVFRGTADGCRGCKRRRLSKLRRRSTGS